VGKPPYKIYIDILTNSFSEIYKLKVEFSRSWHLLSGKTLAKLKYGVEHALEQCNEGRHLVQQSKACSKDKYYTAPQVRIYILKSKVQDPFLHGTVHFLKRWNNFTFVTPPLSLQKCEPVLAEMMEALYMKEDVSAESLAQFQLLVSLGGYWL